MNKNSIYSFAALALLCSSAISCVEDPVPSFGVDRDSIEVGAEGGNVPFRLESGESWVVRTQEPWLTVSPANGNGSTDCTVMVDSALAFTPREGVIRIELLSTGERKDIKVSQKGFDYRIDAGTTEFSLANFAPYGERYFELEVQTNVPFSVDIPSEDRNWLSCTMPELVLDRGARPRKLKLRFDWEMNYNQSPREVQVRLNPVESGLQVVGNGVLKVSQQAAETIEIGVKGDSLALIAINRVLNCMSTYDTSERMEFWNGVTVWKSGPNKGRVRSANFYLFDTKEGLPFQVQYLTAAEELIFFGNTNTFLKDLDPGEHICKLTNLKRLGISAYGLVSLPDALVNLKDLEFLDISGNNFESVPEILCRENFPKLHSLIMNANMRYTFSDLSLATKDNLGGLINESDTCEDGSRGFPKRFLRWSELDTLVFSVNYLQGSIPSLEDDPDFPKWTAEEVHACDTLPDRLIGLPKVLPNTKLLTMNLNRLSGELPDWLLYHPCLDLWVPDALVFPQDGRDAQGNACGFSNTPANLDYYYAEYVNKRYNPKNNTTE